MVQAREDRVPQRVAAVRDDHLWCERGGPRPQRAPRPPEAAGTVGYAGRDVDGRLVADPRPLLAAARGERA